MDRADSFDDELAEVFIKTVQGDYSPKSCVVAAGKLTFSDRPVAWHATPNLALLSQYLRSPQKLPVAIEDWLIALFNQESAIWGGRDDRICRVKDIRRRKRGRPWNPRYPTWSSSLPSKTLQAFEVLKSSETDERECDDLTILSFVLDRSCPLSTPIREWLAELFDPDSIFDFRVKAITRRTEGSKPIGHNPDWWGREAAREVARLQQQGMSRTSATHQVAINLRKPFGTVANAVDLLPGTNPPRKKFNSAD